ncbi:MAG: pyrimidine dimer DNA glycosylase/endonuclease V [Chloroflexota bacterium]|nr:pyrimidine dimer DNA glycosylase/endonuclease V [Chloroflexota bacterium]
MRIWDLEVDRLCRAHLLAEHRELHGMWNILTQGRSGYRRHPETRRWTGRLGALYGRHEAQAAEMMKRGWRHRSALDATLAAGSLTTQTKLVNSLDQQNAILRAKGCACRVDGP